MALDRHFAPESGGGSCGRCRHAVFGLEVQQAVEPCTDVIAHNFNVRKGAAIEQKPLNILHHHAGKLVTVRVAIQVATSLETARKRQVILDSVLAHDAAGFAHLVFTRTNLRARREEGTPEHRVIVTFIRSLVVKYMIYQVFQLLKRRVARRENLSSSSCFCAQ